MSLYYPPTETGARGKSSAREDRYTARFVELTPPRRIVEAIAFDSADPALAGEMRMETTFAAEGDGTAVSVVVTGIPPGNRSDDNAAGARAALEKLVRYVEQSQAGRSGAPNGD
jgi:uncharacterized protein YndB with AHSA1/START domain